MKPATISILSIASTLGLVAAIGFAQPDGIDPPAGPVADTQPSLTSIDQKLDSIATLSRSFPPDLQVFDISLAGNVTVDILGGTASSVRLFAVNMNRTSQLSVIDANNRVLLSVSGDGQRLLGGLEAPTPLTLSTSGTAQGTPVQVYYWIEE